MGEVGVREEPSGEKVRDGDTEGLDPQVMGSPLPKKVDRADGAPGVCRRALTNGERCQDRDGEKTSPEGLEPGGSKPGQRELALCLRFEADCSGRAQPSLSDSLLSVPSVRMAPGTLQALGTFPNE